VRSVLRRSETDLMIPGGILRAGDLVVDVAARVAELREERLVLTQREFEMLAFFMRHPNRAFRREELLAEVWGYTYGDTSTVTVHVRRLREKIEADPSAPRLIETVWGVGYRFTP
jgi:DNA-binding response OmpR family regulator